MENAGSKRRITGSNINRICILILILGLVSATLHYVRQVWFIPADNGPVEGFMNTCSGACNGPIDWVTISGSSIFHSCCKSTTSFASPSWVIDTNGKNRTVAIFNGMKQSYATETCTQINGSSYCKCTTQPTTSTIVVEGGVKKTDYEITWFTYPGCCKCINV